MQNMKRGAKSVSFFQANSTKGVHGKLLVTFPLQILKYHFSKFKVRQLRLSMQLS